MRERMCRLIALVDQHPDNYTLSRLAWAFVESSRFDEYLSRLTNGRAYSHDDGWGLAGVGVVRSDFAVVYHRSLLPLFSPPSIVELQLLLDRLKRYDSIYFIAHARKSSRSEPYGLEYTHPFKFELGGGVFWFAHNGGLDKKSLAKMLGVNPWVHVDSEVAGMYLARRLSECESGPEDCLLDAYRGLVEYTTSGLNTLLLLLSGESPRLFVTHFFKKTGDGARDEALREYYQLYLLEDGHLKAVVSSTVTRYYGGGGFKPLDEGLYELGLNGLRRVGDIGVKS
ncbi:class II glutamine amidotransferase [Thermogladius sp.]|uniref:class II glutamine amidotransferase n=1 Tax=Thermogladius sp. TaxID=2023064 RepID=UPI003D0FE3E1